jgi:hypothetical protein
MLAKILDFPMASPIPAFHAGYGGDIVRYIGEHMPGKRLRETAVKT